MNFRIFVKVSGGEDYFEFRLSLNDPSFAENSPILTADFIIFTKMLESSMNFQENRFLVIAVS